MVSVELPPRWGADSLSAFLQRAYENRFGTFVHKKVWYEPIARIDEYFERVARDWVNPADMITPQLYGRSHGAYRAACEHALSGQAAETFTQVRPCIEYAVYALHINRKTGAAEVWLDRHEGEASLRKFKSEFAIANVRQSLVDVNAALAATFDELYQRAVDFGSHANECAVTSNIEIIETTDGKVIKQIYLHSIGPQMDHALSTTLSAGVCALRIFREILAERFVASGVIV